MNRRKVNIQAIETMEFEPKIKAIIVANKKHVSEMSQNELITAYDMLRNHKEWI